MALDPTLVGRSYPPSAVYEVGRQKITEFAEAIGAAEPVHRDADAARAAGHPDVIAPPTFAIALTLSAGPPVGEAAAEPAPPMRSDARPPAWRYLGLPPPPEEPPPF